MKFLFTLASFLVALGLLIVIHELGHYLVARWCGVKVLRFSVGFGKPLLVRQVGPDRTEWALAAFPLGGYVKMLDEREGPVAPGELPRAFNRQSVYRRFAIVIAGPVANFALAVALYWLLFIYGVPGLKPVVGMPMPDTPAAFSAFQAGETIVKIDDAPMATWQDVRWALLKHAVEKKMVRVEVYNQHGEIAWRNLDLTATTSDDIDSDFLKKLGLTLYQPQVKTVIGHVVPDGAAERAGLRQGDEILSVNGESVSRWEELVKWIRSNGSKPLKLEVKRGNGVMVLAVTPDIVVERGEKIGKIGIAPLVDRAHLQKMVVEVRYAPVPALGKALEKTWDTSVFTLKMLGKMVIGEVSWKNVSGPITIADYAGQSAQMGWVAFLGFMALISISLGVLNLLPVPLLDGGHLMYYTIEIIKGSPISERAMEIGQHVGMALLITLMAFAIYNDINRLLAG